MSSTRCVHPLVALVGPVGPLLSPPDEGTIQPVPVLPLDVDYVKSPMCDALSHHIIYLSSRASHRQHASGTCTLGGE